MGIIKERIRDEIRGKIKKRMEESRIKLEKEKQPEKKTTSGFLSNLSRDITTTAKGVIGLGYLALSKPKETLQTVGSAGVELAKNVPKAVTGLGGEVYSTLSNPKNRIKSVASSYNTLKSIPYKKQSEVFRDIFQKTTEEKDTGKKAIGMAGAGLLEAFIGETTHPGEYFYEKPFSFTLDALTMGKSSGLTKVAGKAGGITAKVASKVPVVKKLAPAVAKLQGAMTETFTPYGKLVNAGYGDLAKEFTKTKSALFRVQKNIIDDTAFKITKEFGLGKAERLDFFKTVDSLRRAKKGIVAVSENPKVQKAIDWWVGTEAPILRKLTGLSEENSITNYMHHFFPDKLKKSDINISNPLLIKKGGYLKKSKDVTGFIEDPIASISAIKSKVATDVIRNSFIRNTISKYAMPSETIEKKLFEMGEDVVKLKETGRLESTAISKLGLAEYKPKGNLRFFPVNNNGKKLVGVSKQVETHLMPKQIVDELMHFTNPKTQNKLFYALDIFNRNWKPMATAMRPRYHTRNIMGNLYNSIIIGGTNPKRFSSALLDQVDKYMHTNIRNKTLIGKLYKAIFKLDIPEPKDLKLAIDNDIIGRGFFGADIGEFAKAIENSDDVMKTIKNLTNKAEGLEKLEPRNLPIVKQWIDVSQKVGSFLEDNARLAMFKQGLKKYGKTAEGIDKSKEYVNKHLFDYLTGLSETDQTIKKFIPFWAWTRFNVPLQVGSIAKIPLRHALLQKGAYPVAKEAEITDKNYENLSDKEKQQGYIKVGEFTKNKTTFDKYIKTASVLPQQDISRLTNILRGDFDELGFTPLIDIATYITKSPTDVIDYFGQPVERFEGERKKFLNLTVTGKEKELLSTIPVLTELNRLIGGSYDKDKVPELSIRLESVISPAGLNIVDRETKKYFKELDKEQKLKGSWEAGWESLYKKNLQKYQSTKEEHYKINSQLLENILKLNGVSKIDIVKLKSKAIKSYIQEVIENKLKQ